MAIDRPAHKATPHAHARHRSLLRLAAGAASAQVQAVIGLITKPDTNPVSVKMKAGFEAGAKTQAAKLLSGADKTDGAKAGRTLLTASRCNARARWMTGAMPPDRIPAECLA